MTNTVGDTGTKPNHFIATKEWNGPGTYTCRCGASIEAVNEDAFRWLFLHHCVEKGVKQARAEVLAACIAELKKQRDRQDQFETREAGYAMAALSVAMDAISKLRPAASDLEALLREERVKELRHFAENAPGYDTDVMRFIDARIEQLEKARAKGKG